jgi:hypothetical protein
MWYITFHGGDDGVNDVHAYDDSGELVVKHVLPKRPPRRELRGIGFGPDGYLYVVNGYKKYSQILRYEGKPCEGCHCFVDVFASKHTVDALIHPFSFAFDPFGYCYVTSQDTNVTTRLSQAGRPKPIAPYLAQTYPHNQLLDGTFVASSSGRLPEVPSASPGVEPPQGLEVTVESGKVSHSVRDVLIYSDRLFVADEPGNAVKIYDRRSGELAAKIADDNLLAAPVHLLARKDNIYIGSTGTKAVLRYAIASGTLHKFIEGLESPSGMTFGRDGCFYVESRKDRCVLKYDEKGNYIDKLIKDLPDEPEFLLHVPDAAR